MNAPKPGWYKDPNDLPERGSGMAKIGQKNMPISRLERCR